MALITSAMLEQRLGRTFTVEETAQADSLIDDASALVQAEAGGALDDTDHTTVPDAIIPVVVSAVRRALVNPDGFVQESLEGYSFSGAPREGVFLTKWERRAVRRSSGKLGVGTAALEGYIPSASSEPFLGGDWLQL